jgi:hypothetical protein
MVKIDEKIAGIADLANLVYASYAGRDFLAKVMPGFVGLALVGYILSEKLIGISDIKDIPFMAWVLILGVCYAVGFTIQRFGESFCIIRLYGGDWDSKKYAKKVDTFFKKAPSMYHRAQRERYVVIKELYGNLAVSLTIGLAVLAIRVAMSGWSESKVDW